MKKKILKKIHSFKDKYLFRRKLRDFMRNNKFSPETGLILCWEFGGFPAILAKDGMFSKALNIRGYKTHFIICDGIQEACIQRGLEKNEKIETWNKKCMSCIERMKEVCSKYSLNYSLASHYIDDGSLKKIKIISQSILIPEIKNYEYLDIPVGDLAWTSLNRYMKGFVIELNDLKQEDEIIYRKFFFAAMVNTQIAENAIRKLNPHSLFTSHGVYVDYAPPVFIASKMGVKTVVWDSGFADFLHYFTVPKNSKEYQVRSLSEKEWNFRKKTKLTVNEEIILADFFHKRYFEAQARDLNILLKPEGRDSLKTKLGIDNHLPIICLFAHINWDAVFGSGVMIFENANEWVIESIKKFISINNVNWIVRVHPGEIMDNSLFTTSDVIRKKFPVLPDHIKVLDHHFDINPYDLFQLIDAGITTYGTVGIELSVMGRPVIVAGNAHFGRKGFTMDARSKHEYFSMLENTKSIKPLDFNQIEVAKKYAYSYFIQRQIPLNIINKAQGHWGDIDLTRLEELLPGKDVAMDKICEGIINGTDVYLD